MKEKWEKNAGVPKGRKEMSDYAERTKNPEHHCLDPDIIQKYTVIFKDNQDTKRGYLNVY